MNERGHGTEPDQSEYDRLGVTPTPDDGTRLSPTPPWDESERPHRERSGPDVDYTRRGRLVGQHLIDVHDMLRAELGELRSVLSQVREGAIGAGDARAALNDMALRQNDWTLGAYCARYCGAVTQHHGLEDDAIFPHLARSEPALSAVIDRLADVHVTIHDAVHAVDRALVDHINRPDSYEGIQSAIDFLTDACCRTSPTRSTRSWSRFPGSGSPQGRCSSRSARAAAPGAQPHERADHEEFATLEKLHIY